MSGDRRPEWKLALVVFMAALAARSAWGGARWWREGVPPGLAFPDEQQYWEMAQSAWRGEGLRDELGFRCGRMPLYPGMLAPFTGFSSGVALAQVMQWVLGAVGAAALSAWATRWGRGVGLASGLLVAMDPFLVFSSSLLLTETIFGTLLIVFWWTLWRAGERPTGLRVWAAAGVLAGASVLVRESSLGLVLVGIIWAVIRRGRRSALGGAAVSMGIVVTMLFPWAVRNHQILGEWCWLTTRGGISLYDGVGPAADGSSDLGDMKRSSAVAGMTELQWDAYFREQAWAELRANPLRVAKLAGVKLARMWNPFPNVESHRSGLAAVVSAGWALPVYLLAMVGVVLCVRREPGGIGVAVFLLIPAAYLSLLHAVFVGSVRYRLPAMPFLGILAAITVVRGCELWSRRNPRPSNA